ncbi:SCO3374 family protein [Streptomyces sp. BI20]|uniref:SCO3374 family protein n=1 Tax=Streptomyces sp. BI20 TaxID=3403460 RepID=UPI003C751F64
MTPPAGPPVTRITRPAVRPDAPVPNAPAGPEGPTAATGTLFDALELPAEAGTALLRRPVLTGPVVRSGAGDRIWFLVAPGVAEELGAVLDWLEWGGLGLDLIGRGRGDRIEWPAPTGPGPERAPAGGAVWLRAPAGDPRDLTDALPALPGPGRPSPGPRGPGAADGPDLVRLIGAAAGECHRARLWAGRRGARTAVPRPPHSADGSDISP